MKLVSYRADGRKRLGRVEGDGAIPLALEGKPADMESLLASGALPDSLKPDGDALPLSGLDVDMPVAAPGKFFCVGLNYRDHAAEGGHAIPDYPAIFTRYPSSFVPHKAPLVRPPLSDRFDYEAELVIVIGKRAHRLTEEAALDVVFGYTVCNDGSLRDYQKKGAQWTPGKNFDRSGSVGPWIVTADALPRGAAGLSVQTRLNGELLQDGNTAELIFPVARILADITAFATLEPGDMIATGTPAGVGFARTPPRWLTPGDVCEVSVEGIGVLSNPVTEE